MDEKEFEYYCESLENSYKSTNEHAVFDVLLLLDIDTENSEENITDAILYFQQYSGEIDSKAPIAHLNKQEVNAIKKDGGFRSGLYKMLLSVKFTEAVENKKLFLKHSYKYSI